MNSVVSIIIPVYNAEKTLSRCLDSVLAVVSCNAEIILVNDGSKDKSVEICEQYASLDKRIKVINKPNGGVSSARNKGLEQAEGNYIMFVDADDELIEFPRNLLLDNKWDVIITNSIVTIKNGERKEFKQFNAGELSNQKEISNFISKNINNSIIRSPWSKLIKKNIIGNIRFDENQIWGEDLTFNLYVYKNAKNIIIIDRPIYCYYYQISQDNKYPMTVKMAINHMMTQYEVYKSLGYSNLEFEKLNFYYCKCLCDEDMKINFLDWFKNEKIRAYWDRIKHLYNLNYRIKYQLFPVVYQFRKSMRELGLMK